MTERRYPVGIQTFSEMIREGYVYVDKTDLVWRLAHYAKFIFMSRPRRFGKSLLTSTLESYFKGDKKLFEGLKIMPLEKEWTEYPVIRLDLSSAKGRRTADDLRQSLKFVLRGYLKIYGSNEQEDTPGQCLTGILQRANEQTGRKVVVIIDEYDAPLLEVLHEAETLDAKREMQAYMAGIPYIEGFNQKLAEAATAEGFYEYTMYLVFSMLNFYVRTQVKCAGGRVDMVVWMPDTIYVFELKKDETAQKALEQIDSKGYAIPYQADGRKVVKVGVKFNADTRVPEEWVIAS